MLYIVKYVNKKSVADATYKVNNSYTFLHNFTYLCQPLHHMHIGRWHKMAAMLAQWSGLETYRTIVLMLKANGNAGQIEMRCSENHNVHISTLNCCKIIFWKT